MFLNCYFKSLKIQRQTYLFTFDEQTNWEGVSFVDGLDLENGLESEWDGLDLDDDLEGDGLDLDNDLKKDYQDFAIIISNVKKN